MKPNSKLDLTGARYYALSDRVKVLLLERLHGAAAPEVNSFIRVSALAGDVRTANRLGAVSSV